MLLPNAPNRDTRVFAGDVPMIQIPPMPHLNKREPHPGAYCDGCDYKFAPNEPCYSDRSGPGRRSITYCLGCQEEGWPCRNFKVVFHS